MVWIVLLWMSLLGFSSEYNARGVQLRYDSSRWRVAETKDPAGSDRNSLVTLEENLEFEKYRTRFSVVIEDASRFGLGSGQAGAARYHNYAIDFLKGQRFHILKKSETMLGNHPALEITAHQRDFGLTFRQWIVLLGQRAVIVTGAARLKRFDLIEGEFRDMAQAIRFDQLS